MAPLYRIDLRQVRVGRVAELLAAELAFPDWEGSGRDAPPRPSLQGTGEVLRSSAQITVYTPETELPFPDDEELGENDLLEWTSRCFDAALGILNQYLVVLATLNDEWHISSISRIDLPRTAPWRLDIYPAAGEREALHGTIDAHSTIRDDLPEERPEEEIAGAIELIHRYRRGEVPFFDSATTAVEVLVNTLFRVLWQLLELEPDGLERALSAPFKNQLVEHLPRLLVVEDIDTSDVESEPGGWFRDCYDLRKRERRDSNPRPPA